MEQALTNGILEAHFVRVCRFSLLWRTGVIYFNLFFFLRLCYSDLHVGWHAALCFKYPQLGWL